MSTGKKSRVPIPLPHNVQGDQPPTVPFHSGSAEVPPPPPTRYHRPGKSASTEESLGETAQIAPRNVYFEPQVEYDDIVTSQNQPGKFVFVESGE